MKELKDTKGTLKESLSTGEAGLLLKKLDTGAWTVIMPDGKEYPPVGSKNRAKHLLRLLNETRKIYENPSN